MTHLHLLTSNAASLAKANNKARRESTASETSFLATTRDKGLEPDARSSSHVASTDTFGAVDLVGGYGHQIDVPVVYVDGYLSDSLGAVGVEIDLLRATQLADLFHGLDDTDLVVDGHDTDEHGVWSDGSLELVHVDQAVLAHGQIGNVETLILHVPAGIQDTFVFGLAGDDVLLLASSSEEPCDTFYAHVVRLCGATGEDDLLGVSSNQFCDVLSGLVRGLLRLPAICVCSRMWIAVHAGHKWQHGVENSGVDWGGSLCIEVDGSCASIHDGSLAQDTCGGAHGGITRNALI